MKKRKWLTKATAAVFKMALANVIMDDDTFSADDQKKVDDTTAELQKAIDGLKLASADGDGSNTGDDDKGDGNTDDNNKGNGTGSGNKDNGSKPAPVKTGDTASMIPMILLLVASVTAMGGVIVVRRKHSK